ncbi:MAG: FAD-binding and (Fe-S)-binding domain-containing protein, partial [Bacteroidales bacterium]
DAGCYHKLPSYVLKPGNEGEVEFILSKLYENRVPITFRAAGTSLSGQAITDSVLLVAAGDEWNQVDILDDGKRIRVQPGITGSRLNIKLKPWNVKFGPDPASVNSAMVGGIVANNAAGMICGIHENSYQTILSARILFSDGTLLDTSDEKSRLAFQKKKPKLIKFLEDKRDWIKGDPGRVDFIRQKYSIKNTTGYSLNSFIDFEDPFDILLHLIVGSEGTLGFLSEIEFKTVPLKPFRASAMLYFRNLIEACKAVPLLKNAHVPAIELIDREALRSVENKKGVPLYIKSFNKDVTALLIDLEAGTGEELEQMLNDTREALSGFKLEREFELTRDPAKIVEYWNVRKGIFPSVGGMRKPGTAVIIEDVAVKTEDLPEAVKDLREMLDKNGYDEAVIYGHALDGNLHFIFSQDFQDPSELKRYEKLINETVKLIVDKYKGSLKAEHGTGINMAPFVKYEWGEELYGLMKEIKSEFDPKNILNPGVLINEDPHVHLKDFKILPEVHESVDKCIECGFCEISCLSTGFNLSARQRIVVQRQLALLKRKSTNGEIKEIESSFKYAGDKSCAGDSLCSVTCPLDIDTGVMIKSIREQRNMAKTFSPFLAKKIASNFNAVRKLIKAGLSIIKLFHKFLGTKVLHAGSTGLRWISLKKIPQWNKNMPGPARFDKKELQSGNENMKVVYFPSCINQSMGVSNKDEVKDSLVDVTLKVLRRAGYHVLFPDNMGSLCCGTPWESKGFTDIADLKSDELENELLKISNNGEYPVLCDTSPCVYRMKRKMDSRLRIYEPVEFAHDHLMDKLQIHKLGERTAFHITCSSTKMDLEDKFFKLASACVENPVFPTGVGCCGFAGDKGFSVPELNEWALRNLKEEVKGCKSGVSNSRTCEIGLSEQSGINYRSVMYLLERCSNDNDPHSISDNSEKLKHEHI